jgi:hypothetical protein
MTKSTAATAIVAAVVVGYVSRGALDPSERSRPPAVEQASAAEGGGVGSDAAAAVSPPAPALAVASPDAAPVSIAAEAGAAGARRASREAGAARPSASERDVDAQIAGIRLRVEQLAQVASVLERPPVATVEALRERVGLGSAQESIAREIVEDTKARLEELRRTPDEEGRTWEQVQAASVEMVGGALRIDEREAIAFRARRIPGRGEEETYGAEEVRLLAAANDRIRSGLTDEQRPKYDALDPTELFGPLPPGGAPIGWPSAVAISLGIDSDPEKAATATEATEGTPR